MHAAHAGITKSDCSRVVLHDASLDTALIWVWSVWDVLGSATADTKETASILSASIQRHTVGVKSKDSLLHGHMHERLPSGFTCLKCLTCLTCMTGYLKALQCQQWRAAEVMRQTGDRLRQTRGKARLLRRHRRQTPDQVSQTRGQHQLPCSFHQPIPQQLRLCRELSRMTTAGVLRVVCCALYVASACDTLFPLKATGIQLMALVVCSNELVIISGHMCGFLPMYIVLYVRIAMS